MFGRVLVLESRLEWRPQQPEGRYSLVLEQPSARERRPGMKLESTRQRPLELQVASGPREQLR